MLLMLLESRLYGNTSSRHMHTQVYHICQSFITHLPHVNNSARRDVVDMSTNQLVDTQNLHHTIHIAYTSRTFDPKHAKI